MLTLEVEFLTGVCFAARSHASEEPDWPPQPDRVFSALAASWSARGQSEEERLALEWLECQAAPRIRASSYDARRVGISYVPPNDVTGKLETLPDRRKRQARTFPAAIPDVPSVAYFWPAEPEAETLASLRSLAHDTSYLGHSASLVRCEFRLQPEPASDSVPARRQVYPGRLRYLVQEYESGRRPMAGELAPPPKEADAPATPGPVFSSEWIVFEDNGGWRPDLLGFAVIARRVRDALMALHGNPVPEWLSGHVADGGPSGQPHLAIVPLADAGWRHSAGSLMGFALVPPKAVHAELLRSEQDWLAGTELENRYAPFLTALESLRELCFRDGFVWRIARTATPTKDSLRPDRYNWASRRWASVTPVALDRYPKSKGADWDEEVGAIVRRSCANTGLPEPESVRVQKHSTVTGAPSAAPSGNGPSWNGWTLPGALAQRVLVHVDLTFSEPVRGPVLLGAGRYAGLGLCLPQGGRR